VAAGKVDAAVMACAGLNRLGMSDKISEILSPKEFLPAPGQGALAVQIRDDDSELAELVLRLDDKNTRISVESERRILSSMHGGCSIPLGVYSEISGEEIIINAVISDVEGQKYIKRTITGQVAQANLCAEQLAQELLQSGGKEILEEIRKS
jgi:hydroxymethylbilane synthase